MRLHYPIPDSICVVGAALDWLWGRFSTIGWVEGFGSTCFLNVGYVLDALNGDGYGRVGSWIYRHGFTHNEMKYEV